MLSIIFMISDYYMNIFKYFSTYEYIMLFCIHHRAQICAPSTAVIFMPYHLSAIKILTSFQCQCTHIVCHFIYVPLESHNVQVL
jgi:hypothetical protein